MSTNKTILLTDQNEHWYHDNSEKEFVIEVGREHLVDSQGMGETVIVIREGTSLYQSILELLYSP